MLVDKFRCIDWEVINEVMEEVVVRELYLEWFRDREKRVRGIRILVMFFYF